MSYNTKYNQFLYADTAQPYQGQYIQIKGKYYAGQTFVVQGSRQIIRKPQNDDNQTPVMYPYAVRHRKFVTEVLSPDLQLVQHPIISILSGAVRNVYILQRIKDGSIYEVTKSCFDSLYGVSPLYKYFVVKIQLPGDVIQQRNFNKRQLFSLGSYNIVQFIKNTYSIIL